MESKHRFPNPWKSLGDSHIPHRPDDEADGKVENQKQVYHFPTARFLPLSLKQNIRARLSASRLPLRHVGPAGNNSCPPNEKILDPDQAQWLQEPESAFDSHSVI